MRLLVFLQGTTIMHASGAGRTREERVRQVRGATSDLRDLGSYVPIGHAVRKLAGWAAQGGEITYLSAHRSPKDAAIDEAVVRRYGFPPGRVAYRQGAETYADVAEREMPDVLVEDDCESIGGMREMASPHLRPHVAARVASIVVPEFGGIDHLPDSLEDLPAGRPTPSSPGSQPVPHGAPRPLR